MPRATAPKPSLNAENYDPLAPEFKPHFKDIASELQESCPVHHHNLTADQLSDAAHNDFLDGRPSDMYSLMRHADVEAALLDPGTFLSGPGIGVDWGREQESGGALTNADGEAHTRSRRRTQPALSPKVINPMAAMLQARIDQLIDGVAESGECDVMTDFALPLTCGMLETLLGFPSDRRGELQEWAFALLEMFGGDEAAARRGEAALVGISTYISEVGGERLAAVERGEDPSDGFTRLLTATDDRGERFTHNELVNVLFQVISGGFDTTATAICNGVALLCENPSERAKLEADPNLIGTAVEEVLRYMAPAEGMFRTTARDVDVAGVVIPAGSKVRMNFASANLDERAFGDAQVFKIDRSRSELMKHTSFGKGVHTCLGNSLARQELKLALSSLFHRLPTLQLKPGVERSFHSTSFIYGYSNLPVTWDPSTVLPA